MRLLSAAVVVFVSYAAAWPAPYKELVPKFNRSTSNAMVREIQVPTLANLDYAAYDKNPVLLDLEKANPKKPAAPVKLEGITFDGAIADVKGSFAAVPLTALEKEHPLAWPPVIKKLWAVVKEQGFQNITSKVNSYKWADPDIYQPYQQISTAWLHDEAGKTQIWVKVEFSPWVKFVPAVDEDKDGFKEIYGRLVTDAVSADSLKKAYDWIRSDYTVKVCNNEQMVDWITDLASYWYPTKNTDIIDMTGQDTWPNAQTKKAVLGTLKGLKVKKPLAVVEGKPVSPDKPVYNVYVVTASEKAAPVQAQQAPAVVQPVTSSEMIAENAAKPFDTAQSRNFKENNARFEKEIKEYGDYASWAKKNTPFFDGVKKMMAALPAEQMGFKGKEDWLFFRKSVDYLLGGDLAAQAKDKNAIPNLVDFKKYLDKYNVNLLFVVVPNKEEIYYDRLPIDNTKVVVPYVNPYSRKILKDIQAAGIEVMDLLPAFLKAKQEDPKFKESVYQHQDTHWTDRGLELAADMVATRIKEYGWYGSIKDKVAYTFVDTTFERQGDIVERLPEPDRVKYPAVKVQAKQVRMTGGAPYKGSADSPIMLIGDSFTGVFESVDCKSAGVGAHIAEKTGVSVDIITSWGGGPLVRAKAMRAREKNLPNKRLVVYMMVARDLYNYSQLWEQFPVQAAAAPESAPAAPAAKPAAVKAKATAQSKAK